MFVTESRRGSPFAALPHGHIMAMASNSRDDLDASLKGTSDLVTKDTHTSAQKLRQLLAFVDNDAELARNVIQLFAGQAPALLCEMREAIAKTDTDGIYRSAHSLRGAAANFGPDPLLNSLSAVEAAAASTDVEGCAAAISLIEVQTAALLELLRSAEETLPCAS